MRSDECGADRIQVERPRHRPRRSRRRQESRTAPAIALRSTNEVESPTRPSARSVALSVPCTADATAERVPGAQEASKRIPARNLAVGDILHLNDWRLHVIQIERDQAMAVLTAEFAFLIHFAYEDLLTVQTRVDAI
jgi:hypothetical protein